MKTFLYAFIKRIFEKPISPSLPETLTEIKNAFFPAFLSMKKILNKNKENRIFKSKIDTLSRVERIVVPYFKQKKMQNENIKKKERVLLKKLHQIRCT